MKINMKNIDTQDTQNCISSNFILNLEQDLHKAQRETFLPLPLVMCCLASQPLS